MGCKKNSHFNICVLYFLYCYKNILTSGKFDCYAANAVKKYFKGHTVQRKVTLEC